MYRVLTIIVFVLIERRSLIVSCTHSDNVTSNFISGLTDNLTRHYQNACSTLSNGKIIILYYMDPTAGGASRGLLEIRSLLSGRRFCILDNSSDF